ncbi:MAG: hypothetical protein AAGJ81_07555 [Verrucomicrobiota bacterium]
MTHRSISALILSTTLSLESAPEVSVEHMQVFPEFLKKGEFQGNAGTAFNFQENKDASDSGLAWAYLQAGYDSSPIYGFSGGIKGLGVAKLWENHPGDFSADFVDEAVLQQLYLDYEDEVHHWGGFVGRRAFSGSPVLDGDYQQGINLSAGKDSGYQVSFSLINRWIEYAEYDYDADGISGWQDVSDASPDAADIHFALQGSLPISEVFTVAPFLNYQEGLIASYGSSFDTSLPAPMFSEDATWETNLILAYYDNLISSSIEPDYGSVLSGLIHTGIETEQYSFGAGIFYVSDNNIDINAGVFTAFDPLQEDDLYPFNDENDLLLFYLDGSVTFGDFTLNPAFGFGKNYALESDSLELDLLFTYDLPGGFSLEGFFVAVDFSNHPIPDYNVYGALIDYSF